MLIRKILDTWKLEESKLASYLASDYCAASALVHVFVLVPGACCLMLS